MLRMTGNAPVGVPVAAPRRPDGSAYRWEMVVSDGRMRAYADTVVGLLDALIPGHADLGADEGQAARVRHAYAVRPYLQAEVAAEADLDALTEEEKAAVSGQVPDPELAWWEHEFPLVLVASGYAPEGSRSRPLTPYGDVQDPPTILWLRPGTPEGYVLSLARAGWVSLHQHKGLAPQ